MTRGVINAYGELRSNLRIAREQGLVNDVTFIFADGIKICSNKTLLSVRCPFFASMFLGGFKDTIESEIEFKSCNSEIFKLILDYLWNGSFDCRSFSIQVLLNLMETSRLLCLDTLYKSLENFIIFKINESSFNHDDWLEALDFAILNKFDNLSTCALVNIDKNLDKILESPRFKILTESSLLSILMYETRTLEESFVFKAFMVWMEENEDIDMGMKSKMLETFDLKQFSKSFLLSTVRKTRYFNDDAIYDVLEGKVAEAEQELEDSRSELKEAQLNFITVQSELESTQRKLLISDAGLQIVRSQLISTKSELLKAQTQQNSTQIELDRSREEVQGVRLELDSSKSELRSIQDELHDVQSQLDYTEDERDRSREEVQEVRLELGNSKSELHCIQEELHDVQSQLDYTQYELENAHRWKGTKRGYRKRN